MGYKVHKCTSDLWVYQEILHQTRPSVIIETGTSEGGSALYLAQMGELLGGIRVISVDVENSIRPSRLPSHPRIEYLTGSSVDPTVVRAIRDRLRPEDRVMVVLDSDHSQAHVRAELDAYAPLVTPGCFLIVEDTVVNGNPIYPLHGPGPMEAVKEFLPQHPEFEPDRSREKFFLSFNPNGYLRRK
jgi:cephalosporin hydroxylase